MAKRTKYKGDKLRSTFTHEGKRYYIYGRTQEELAQKEVQKRSELREGTENRHNPTLEKYYNYMTDIRRRELKESTLRAQRSQFKNIADVVMVNGRRFGEYRIQDITRRDIEKARQSLLSSGKTPQNLNIIFAHLNHVFTCAVLDDTIDKNPCKALKPLKREGVTVGETKHRALTQEETKKFFEVAENRKSYYLNNFKMLIKTGLRIGELTALYRTDIDTKNGFIHVRRTVARTEAGAYTVGEDAKTKSGQRDIPLTADLQEIVKAQENINRYFFGDEIRGLLFKSTQGSILREYSINREIKRICEDAGIEPFTCHAFRNTFATRWIEQRPQDYKILSEILGHKDISITLNLYTHVMTDNKVKAMQDIKINIG